MLNVGRIALVLSLIYLNGCVSTGVPVVNKCLPSYNKDFVGCVADDLEDYSYSECTEDAITDWFTCVE